MLNANGWSLVTLRSKRLQFVREQLKARFVLSCMPSYRVCLEADFQNDIFFKIFTMDANRNYRERNITAMK